jgi:hypothetical protein
MSRAATHLVPPFASRPYSMHRPLARPAAPSATVSPSPICRPIRPRAWVATATTVAVAGPVPQQRVHERFRREISETLKNIVENRNLSRRPNRQAKVDNSKFLEWARLNDRCRGCGAFLILALPPGGKGRRTFQCFECDRPDPLKTDHGIGWLKSELRPPE